MSLSTLSAFFLLIALGVVAGYLALRRGRTLSAPEGNVRALLQNARQRALIAVISAAIVFVAVCFIGLEAPSLLGLPFVLAPGIAGIAGLLLYSVTPPQSVPIAEAAQRDAALIARTPWTFVSVPVLLAPTIIAAVYIVALIIAGLTSSTDVLGRFNTISFEHGDHQTGASPYPGWFYGVPLIIMAVAVIATTVVAFHRVSSTPALSGEYARADEGWRRTTTRIISAISCAALLFPFGGVSLIGGSALCRAYIPELRAPIWQIAGSGALALGAVLLVCSVIALTLAGMWAYALPSIALASSEESAANASTEATR